jgi:hypothetical protein
MLAPAHWGLSWGIQVLLQCSLIAEVLITMLAVLSISLEDYLHVIF